MKHFYRNFTTKLTKHKVDQPDYLGNFKKPHIGNTAANIEMLQSGEYDLHQEDVLLTQLGSLIGYDSNKVDELISNKLGLIPLIAKKEDRDEHKREAARIALNKELDHADRKQARAKERIFSEKVTDKYVQLKYEGQNKKDNESDHIADE